MISESWFVYIVRCADDTLYTGVSNDIDRRISQHNGDIPGGAKYTLARKPVEVVYQQMCDDRSSALKEEYRIKQLSRQEKEVLIKKNLPG